MCLFGSQEAVNIPSLLPAANFDGENVLAAMWTETLGADDDDSARLLSSQNKQPFHRSSFYLTEQTPVLREVRRISQHRLLKLNQANSRGKPRKSEVVKKKEIEGESRFFSSLKTLLMTKTTNRIFLCRGTKRTEASLSGVSSYFVHPLYIVWLVLWYCRKNCFSSFGSVTTTTTKRNHSFQLES